MMRISASPVAQPYQPKVPTTAMTRQQPGKQSSHHHHPAFSLIPQPRFELHSYTLTTLNWDPDPHQIILDFPH